MIDFLHIVKLSLTMIAWTVDQVHEKKIKKLCDMNIDSSAHSGNGSMIMESSVINPVSYASCSSNGGGPLEQTSSQPSNDFEFPPGGIPSLRLPMVWILSNLCYWHLVVFFLFKA